MREPNRVSRDALFTMTHDREKISTGPNAEPLDETIAGTGPGIPDDALAPGEDELPQPPTDEQVEKAAEALHADRRTRHVAAGR
jgi:hypothetical protein